MKKNTANKFIFFITLCIFNHSAYGSLPENKDLQQSNLSKTLIYQLEEAKMALKRLVRAGQVFTKAGEQEVSYAAQLQKISAIEKQMAENNIPATSSMLNSSACNIKSSDFAPYRRVFNQQIGEGPINKNQTSDEDSDDNTEQ